MPTARTASQSPPAARRAVPRHGLRWCWAYARQQFVVFSFFGIGLAVSSLCVPLSALFGRWIPAAAAQGAIRTLFRFWLNLSIRIGVFDIRFPESGTLQNLRRTIIAPNHPTMLDAVILLSIVPQTVCIMRASLMKNLSLGGAARLAGFVTNDSGPALIHQGVEKIHSGENLLIFPEGTRTGPESVNPFKHGFALIAIKSGAPIQSVFIERESRYLGKGVSLFAPTSLPIRYRLRLGEPFVPAPGESAQCFAKRLEDYFQSRLVRAGEAIRVKPANSSPS